ALCLSSLCLLCDPHPHTGLHTLSLHDALPILAAGERAGARRWPRLRVQVEHGLDERHARLYGARPGASPPPPRRDHLRADLCLRSEEHTSELQSRENLVCRLLLEKKKLTSLT